VSGKPGLGLDPLFVQLWLNVSILPIGFDSQTARRQSQEHPTSPLHQALELFMKLVSYNIRFGLGLDQRIDLLRIADTVRGADIIALQEVERFWNHSAMADQPEILAEHLDEFYWSFFPAFDVDASTKDKVGKVTNKRRQFGPMIFSRWPILSSRFILLPKLDTITELNMDTGAIECVIDAPSGPLKVTSLHLSAVSPRERALQIDHLLAFHRNAHIRGAAWSGGVNNRDPVEVKHMKELDWANGKPIPPTPNEAIVMGDFNLIPTSSEYEQITGKVDPCYGRVAHLDGFVDTWDIAKTTGENRVTWLPDPPERAPGYGITLDYCFVSPHLARKVSRSWIDHDAIGSDHKPLWVELI
jgi:endonuclease/exonuclease/phosphatase family metal-dependent hydrolase